MLEVTNFIEYSGVCDLDKATSALTQAEGFVATILGDINESEKTEKYHGNGEMSLVLKRSPLMSVAEMKFNGEVVDPTSYFPDEAGIIHRKTPFPRGFNVIEVTYTAGWTKETIPANLKYAIYNLARAYHQAGDSLGSNVKSESIDGASISWGDMPISDELNIINSYRKIYV